MERRLRCAPIRAFAGLDLSKNSKIVVGKIPKHVIHELYLDPDNGLNYSLKEKRDFYNKTLEGMEQANLEQWHQTEFGTGPI